MPHHQRQCHVTHAEELSCPAPRPRHSRPSAPAARARARPARPAGRPRLPPPRPDRARLARRPRRSPSGCRRPSPASSRPTTPRPGRTPRQAQDLLEERFPASPGDTVDVVVHSADARSPARRPAAEVQRAARHARPAPHVAGVDRPVRHARRHLRRRPDRSSPTLRLDVVEPRRHAGRGQPAADATWPTTRGPRRPAGRPRRPDASSRPSRARSAPRASASPPPRSSCC